MSSSNSPRGEEGASRARSAMSSAAQRQISDATIAASMRQLTEGGGSSTEGAGDGAASTSEGSLRVDWSTKLPLPAGMYIFQPH